MRAQHLDPGRFAGASPGSRASSRRTDGGAVSRELGRCGIEQVVLATGDQRGVTEALVAGLPAIAADLDRAAKTDTVAAKRRNGPVMMVGDGVNDTPAPTGAGFGVALGARGAAAVVLLVDILAPLPESIRIARRVRAIAFQGVPAGIGLSLAMVMAALSHLPPLQGALLQETIDVAVILSTMRARRSRDHRRAVRPRRDGGGMRLPSGPPAACAGSRWASAPRLRSRRRHRGATEVAMDFANIIVSVDLGDAAPDRIRLAGGLARRFDATLTGAAAHKVPAPILVRDVYDAVEQEERNTAEVRGILEDARAQFEHGAGEGTRTEWRAALAGPVTHLVEQARAADLVVVGRHGPEDEDTGPIGVPPGPVLMEAGRPVIVVPPRLVQLAAARVVVAWKDGPEARRAVAAALPLLREANEVFVATVGADARHQGAEDVAGHLARHGAHVSTHLLRTAGRESDEVIDFARRVGADLVVTGAYGHSRLREWIFGGFTRDLLDRSPVCCLMCH